jgi:hypothetical protein
LDYRSYTALRGCGIAGAIIASKIRRKFADVMVKLTVDYDDEAKVWYVKTSDLLGVHAEGETLDELCGKLPAIVKSRAMGGAITAKSAAIERSTMAASAGGRQGATSSRKTVRVSPRGAARKITRASLVARASRQLIWFAECGSRSAALRRGDHASRGDPICRRPCQAIAASAAS